MMMGGYAEALEWFTAACDEPDVKLLMAENRAACLQRMDAKELPEALETWKRCMQQVIISTQSICRLSIIIVT